MAAAKSKSASSSSSTAAGAIRSTAAGSTRRSTAASAADHWAFLDEIEAPSWADLTLESQFMDQDIDDAWFRTSHPIHQMSSRLLKSRGPYCIEENVMLPDLPCTSPGLPDSVSRSRGKDYKSRTWVDGEQLLMDKLHPIRNLGGKDVADQNASGSMSSSTSTTSLSHNKLHPIRKLGRKTVAGQLSCGSNSSSTVMMGSSRKKLPSGVDDLKCSSSSKSSLTTNTSSVSSGVSKHVSLKPNMSFRGPSSTSDAKAYDSGGSSSSTTCLIRGEVRGKSFPHDRRSTSSKSSVGSSYSLECKLEGIDSAGLLRVNSILHSEKDSRLATVKEPKRQIPDRTSSAKNQKKAVDAKIACQEPKSKGLSSGLSRKPLRPLNEDVPVKVRTVTLATQPRQSFAARKLNSVSVSNKTIVAEKTTQDPKALKPSGTRLMRGSGFPDCKGKSNERKRETNMRTVDMRPFR